MKDGSRFRITFFDGLYYIEKFDFKQSKWNYKLKFDLNVKDLPEFNEVNLWVSIYVRRTE